MSRSIRFQLLLDSIDRQPYISPIENELSLESGDENDFYVTDDPHYLTMGKMSMLGKQAIIKMTNVQINALYDRIFKSIYSSFEQYQLAKADAKIRTAKIGRKSGAGYKLGMVARVDRPLFIENYHCKYRSVWQLITVIDGVAFMSTSRSTEIKSVAPYSRIRKQFYNLSVWSIDASGKITRLAELESVHDIITKDDITELVG